MCYSPIVFCFSKYTIAVIFGFSRITAIVFVLTCKEDDSSVCEGVYYF